MNRTADELTAEKIQLNTERAIMDHLLACAVREGLLTEREVEEMTLGQAREWLREKGWRR